VPKLSDKLIGTSVGGEIEDITYNFTLLELLELFLPIIPANNLQGVLDYGNTATQDINLFGTITTTNLDVTDTTNLFITYLNEETHLVGSLFDSADSVGTAGQVLTSTGDGVEWFTLPPIFTPNLEQVLTEGNTSDIDILLDANLEALDVSADTATVGVNLTIGGTITDNSSAVGSAGQVLSSTVTGVAWVSLPVYSATSPLLFNSATGVFSIQVANSTQGGYLTANDWVTFDGKQNAGAYITALTGEATATGPGSVPITLNNASVTAKVLTGLNITGGSISASDSILTAFGKVQSQINGLMGGVQYQGVWDAATNTPTLTSSVGTQGHYYIVNVAGNTDLNGITDWKVGDWAIFSGGTWQKVDNTESVTSVNGQTGAVSLTTDNIPEGATNLYYLDSRARGALSFAAGSGAYNSLTGVITIPTDNNQILNGAGYITLASLSATAPLTYNNLTGAFGIPKATTLVDGYLSAIDWTTFNNKQNYLGGTGLVKSTAGTITYITDNSGNWNTAYDRSIISAAVTGTTTKTLTLNEQDGGTITASWTDLDTGLTSVGVSMPSAFSVANSPLTSNGTIAVTGAGTTLQYIDGTGALRTFPGLTGYVPYTGATTNVDLGEFGISAGYFQADLTPTGALQVGRMQWNSTDGTMDLRLLGNNVTLQIGQENVTRVVNKSGIDLLEANYQVVRIRKVAEGGAQGQRLAVVLAQGNNENNSTEVIGLVTETINVNQEGFVTSFGEVKSINTTGSLQGETWVDGDILYLSSTVAGQLTNIRPVAPNHSVIVGYVVYAHANNGKIYMAIDTGYELGELHNVYAPSPTANQSIYWNVANSRYQLNTIGGILGYTPANAATTISTTAPLQGGGDLSANRTFSITQSGASTDGYLSSTDWNTFNNKQPAGSYVPTSRQLTINGTAYDLSADRTWSVGTVTSVAALTLGTTGTDLSSSVATGTTTPVITLNVPTASAANRGALSAVDWSTFNTKVGSVTATSPLASSGGQTPNITIQQSSGSQDGYLSSTDWTTFNSKQAAGNYITSLTGEATATGPGAAAVTLNNASVTGKVLTGVNITGGTVQATDTMLTAFGKLQNQINGLIGSTIYQGTWNASTNTPSLASGVGVRGYYYIVSVAGNTNLDGITDWFIGDWAIFDGTAWQQVDNTDAVVSVNGQTGAVSLTTDNIPEGSTNQYFLNSRARAALSFTAGSGAYNSTTGVITIPTNTSQLTNGANFITLGSLSGTAPISYNSGTGAISITQSGTASNGFLSSTDWNTFNNKQPAGSYVTLTGVETLSNKTFSNVVNLSVNGFILAGVTGVNPLQMYSTTLTSNFLFSSNSFGTNINNDLFYSKDSNNKSVLSFNNTAERTYTFPNASGTIALVGGSGVGTVTSVAALTIGTSGTDLSSTVANSTTTPVITLNVPTASAANRGALSAADWTTFNNKQPAGNYVTLDTTQTITGKKTFSNAFGDMNPIIVLEGTSSDSFQYPTSAYNSGLSAGQTIAHFIGKASSSKNSAFFGYQYAGVDSDSNFLTLGIWGFNHLLKIYPTGAATLSGAFTASIAALSTASNAFVVSDSGTLKYRTAAQVLSDIGGQSALTNPVTGTGTTNYVSKFTGTSTIGNSLIYDNGSSVSINTTLTPYLFNVNQAADVWHMAVGNVSSTGQMLRIGGNALSGTTPYATLGSYVNNTGNTGSLLVLQRDGGNLIIGGGSIIVDSGVLFQVNGSAEIKQSYNGLTRLNIINTTSGTGAYVETSYTTNAAGNGSIGKYSTTTTAYKIITASNTYLFNGGSGDLAILNDFAAGSIKMAAGGSSSAHLTIASSGIINLLSTDTSGARTTLNDVLTITQLNPNNPYSGFGTGLLFRGNTYRGIYNWGKIGMQLTDNSENTTGENMIFQVAAADNSDTLTTVLTLGYNGAATFSSTITSGSITANSGGRTLTFDNITNYGQSLVINSAGSLPLYLQTNGTNALTINSSQAAIFSSSVTASIPALATASNAFVVSDSGTLKYRTAAQVLSDIGGQASGSYVTIDTVQTITGKKTFSNAFGDNDPILALVGTSTGSFQYLTTAYNLSQPTGATVAHFIGRASSSKNSGYLGYQWSSNSSDSNFLSLGLYGVDHVLKIYGSGYSVFNNFVGIGIDPSYKLQVYTDADVWHTVIGGGTGQLRIGGQTSDGAVIQAYTVSGGVANRNIYLQRDGANVIVNGTTNTGDRLQVNGTAFVSSRLGIGATSSIYSLQLGTVGSLTNSIRMGTYQVPNNTRQYIGYTREDTGLFESSGDGDTPSTVLGGVAGIRIVNTVGTLAPAQADNSVQLLTHIYNGGSRVALHANYNGYIGLGTITPNTRLEVYDSDGSGVRTSPFNVVTITADNPSNPYNGFGAGLLFKNRIYAGGPSAGGIQNGARIRTSLNTNSSVNYGTELVFDVTTAGNGSLTEALRLSYNYGATFTGDVTLAGGKLTINRNTTGLVLNRDAVTNYNGIYHSTAGAARWFIGLRENLSSNNYICYSEQTAVDVMTLNVADNSASFAGNLFNNGLFRTAGSTNAVYWSGASQSASFGAILGDSTTSRTAFFRSSTVGGAASVWWGAIDSSGRNIPVAAIDGTTTGGLTFWNNTAGSGGGTWTKIFEYNANGVGINTTPSATYALNVNGSVQATAYFESSDSRLKQLIKDDYKTIGIESIKARLYLKEGKEEIGYYAQDFETILPSAVSKNDAGFLSLSYTQVHTAKIAIIEDEVTILKKRVAELESKLQA
jgi:hypothetical protein